MSRAAKEIFKELDKIRNILIEYDDYWFQKEKFEKLRKKFEGKK